MHEANVQRAVKHARRKLGISVLPHELRHGYATHCLERGTNPRAIQAVMGHQSLETTMGCLHAEALSVGSPLDALALPLTLPPKDQPLPQHRQSQPEGGASSQTIVSDQHWRVGSESYGSAARLNGCEPH